MKIRSVSCIIIPANENIGGIIMLSNFLEIVIPEIIHLLEAMGVIIIFIGAIIHICEDLKEM